MTLGAAILVGSDKKKYEHFLNIAKSVSEMSKDPSTKCGAVIVDPEYRIVSTGYNGFPRSIPDMDEFLHDRKKKYLLTIHAEMNAILFARQSLRSCKIFVWPILPCSECMKHIIQSGIEEVVIPHMDVTENYFRWRESFQNSLEIANMGNVMISVNKWVHEENE